ncbi:hypothetical protein LCGC14_1158710 [marine sediment metagenome]|uniref:Uncharacterized protein n=1 Tax=marine sediment metagenome TaxID=412755 RepID=A0A0F9PYW7_9ZZZZ|nr:hypothetical protein [bacterium]
MKFLLKQKLNYKKAGFIYYFYPNQFSSQIIKQAKKKDLILDINYKWYGKYRIVDSYLILEKDFKRLRAEFKKKILEKRVRFYQQDYLIQLIKILKYIFQRNNRAKENRMYSSIQKAYNDKEAFLELALSIAKKVRRKDFLYGWKEDPQQSFHNYIYYFQFGKKQVSFHSDELVLECPEFQGEWIGYRNETFPFKLNVI